MKKTSPAPRLAATACLTAALVLAAPASALAAGTSASTGVYLKADSSKLVVSAPTRIDFGVTGDGSFITPDASAVQLRNGSVFAVKLASIGIEGKNGFSLVGKSAFASTADSNALHYTLALGSGTPIDAAACTGSPALSTPDANMAKTGEAGATINVTTEGAIKNITKDLAAEQQHSEITWTFEAGANA